MTSDVKLDENGAAGDGAGKLLSGGGRDAEPQIADGPGEGELADDPAAAQRLQQLLDNVVGGLDQSYQRYGNVLDDLRSRLNDLSDQTAATAETDPGMQAGANGGGAKPGEGDLQNRFEQITLDLEATLNASSAESADGFQQMGSDLPQDLQVLQALVIRLESMEGSLMRAEAHAARIETIEDQLFDLIELIGNPASQVEQAAKLAAAETAERLKDEREAAAAAARLDAIQQELSELNQRAALMDKRTSGALDAIGDRLQSLSKRYPANLRSGTLRPTGAKGRKSGNGNGNGAGNGNGYHHSFRMESAGEPIIVHGALGRELEDHGAANRDNGDGDHEEPEDEAPKVAPVWKAPRKEQRASVSVVSLAAPTPDTPPSAPEKRDEPEELGTAKPRPGKSTNGDSLVVARLELLESSLLQLFQNIPDDEDRFELILTRDKPARLRIDNSTHIAMNPDARIYRLIRSTSKGRKVLAETEDVIEIGKHVTDYVVSQMAVRQRQRQGFANHLMQAPVARWRGRRGTVVLFWAFLIGLLTGSSILLAVGYMLSR